MRKRVIIIGGGIAGLSAAYSLQEEARAAGLPLTCTLLEGDTRVGGKIKTEHIDGFTIDGGPDCFLSRKPWALQLCRKVGLSSDLMGTNDDRRKTYVLNKGKLTPLPDGVMLIIPTRMMPFVTSTLISWPGKMRMGMDMFIPPRRDESDETVGDFVRRRLGSEALDKIAEPLMSGIHISDPEYQSLLGSFPLFREMERKHGSLIRAMLRQKAAHAQNGGMRGAAERALYGGLQQITRMVGVPVPPELPRSGHSNGRAPAPAHAHNGHHPHGAPQTPLPMFMTLRHGLGQFVQAIADALEKDTIYTGKQVVKLEQRTSSDDEPRYRVFTADGDTFEADAVVLASPSYVTAELLAQIDPTLSAALNRIRYVTTSTVSLGYRMRDIGKPFDGFGFVIPRKEHRQITGCTWTSTKFDHRAPDDRLLLRCFIGGPGHEDRAELDDESLVAMVRRELEDIMGLRAEPVLTRIFRWTKANPQYDVGHLERVSQMHAMCANHPGLFFAGSAYEGVGVPDCIHQGQKAAKKALAHLLVEQSALVEA